MDLNTNDTLNMDGLPQGFHLLKPNGPEPSPIPSEKMPEDLSVVLLGKESGDQFFVRTGGSFEKVVMSEIIYISGMGNYIKIHFSTGRALVVHSTMKSFSGSLEPSRFIMIHKRYIINLTYILSYNSTHVKLSEIGRIPIGRSYKAGVILRLKLLMP